MNQIVSVENLSKKYCINHQGQKYTTLRDALVQKVAWIWNRIAHPSSVDENPNSIQEDFWALQDITFEVNRGDKIGIIGRNGAGKSTLLKVLSRITEPTNGRVVIRGRLASLLEVGTGFHPELTGRENIYLNGAILGMTSDEIRKNFDEIVAFAEVEKFLDTPVKHYSSGMYVRLAFSVAAHLEPEILIVDEVLAVGDAEFQKRCLEKMGLIAKAGKTIFLVSHQLPNILALSSKCFLMAGGRIINQGLPSEIVNIYQKTYLSGIADQADLSSAERYGTGEARFSSIKCQGFNKAGLPSVIFETGSDIQILLTVNAIANLSSATVAIIIYDHFGNRLIDANSYLKGKTLSLTAGQAETVCFILKNVLLKPDVYIIGLWLGGINCDIDGIRYALSIKIEHRSGDEYINNPFPGIYLCDFIYEDKMVNNTCK